MIYRPRINTILIILFLLMWLWTEVSEYQERHTIYMEFKKFHDAGERFTKQDGDKLRQRVEALEDEQE